MKEKEEILDFCERCGYMTRNGGCCNRYKLCARWLKWFRSKWIIIRKEFEELKKE